MKIIFVITAAVSLLSVGAAEAQTTAPQQGKPRPVPADTYDWNSPTSPWNAACAPKNPQKPELGQACQMVQTLNVAETGQRLLSAVIRYPTGKKNPILLFTLPHGLFFQAGVRVQIDKGKARVLPYQSSDIRGAYSGMALNKVSLTALKRGKALNVTIYGAARKPLKMKLSLKGFTNELKRLQNLGRKKP